MEYTVNTTELISGKLASCLSEPHVLTKDNETVLLKAMLTYTKGTEYILKLAIVCGLAFHLLLAYWHFFSYNVSIQSLATL